METTLTVSVYIALHSFTCIGEGEDTRKSSKWLTAELASVIDSLISIGNLEKCSGEVAVDNLLTKVETLSFSRAR
jgi:hypothetical protein